MEKKNIEDIKFDRALNELILYVTDKHSSEKLDRYNIDHDSENDIGFVNGRNFSTVKKGDKYNYVFSTTELNDIETISAFVSRISTRRDNDMEELDGDFTGADIVLSFAEKPKTLLNNLQDSDEEYDSSRHHFLCFVSQEALDKILAENIQV